MAPWRQQTSVHQDMRSESADPRGPGPRQVPSCQAHRIGLEPCTTSTHPPPESVQRSQISYVVADLLLWLSSHSGLCSHQLSPARGHALLHAAASCSVHARSALQSSLHHHHSCMAVMGGPRTTHRRLDHKCCTCHGVAGLQIALHTHPLHKTCVVPPLWGSLPPLQSHHASHAPMPPLHTPAALGALQLLGRWVACTQLCTGPVHSPFQSCTKGKLVK